jgi:hypothetical protein
MMNGQLQRKHYDRHGHYRSGQQLHALPAALKT